MSSTTTTNTTAKPNLLIVLTSHPTGWYLPELSHPFSVFSPIFTITTASPLGGEAPLDESSIDAWKDDGISAAFLRDHSDLWKQTYKLEDFVDRVDEFDAVFYVGGYGPMFDLADTPTSQNLILAFYEASKPISFICHGPAPLAHLKLPGTDEYLLEGHHVTGLSKAEVDLMPTVVPVPFELEEGLNTASGGGYEKAEPWGEKVVVSKGRGGRVIITGQNPSSGRKLAEEVVKAVTGKRV